MTFKTSISPKDKPTIETFHSLVTSVLPPGIYHGGAVAPGGARSISVSPFVARAPQGGFTINSETAKVVALPTPGTEKNYLLVLKAIPWVPGTIYDDHRVSLELIEGTYNETNKRWEPLPGYLDANYILILAKVRVDSPAVQPQLLSSDIDASIASTIDFQYQSGRVMLSGTGSYNGQHGAVVTHNLATTNYRVAITTTDLIPNAVGLGDVWVVKQPNYFTVYATSHIQNLAFDWTLTTSPDTLSTPTGSGAYGAPISQGPPGVTGEAGPAGSAWLTGSGVPAGSLGRVNDMYLDTASGDTYQKVSSDAWEYKCNLTQTPEGPVEVNVPTRSIGAGAIYEALLDLPGNRIYGVSTLVAGLLNTQSIKVQLFSSGPLGSFTLKAYDCDFTTTQSSDVDQMWYYRDQENTKKMRVRITNLATEEVNVSVAISVEPF